MGVLVCDRERKRDRAQKERERQIDRQREVLIFRSLSIIVS